MEKDINKMIEEGFELSQKHENLCNEIINNENAPKELICEKESLLDYMWLFNNIPWSNFDGENATISFNTPIEAYAIDIDGADTNIIGLKKFYFDNVIITAFHATVNHFSFIFNLSGEKTYATMDYTAFGYSIDEIKNRSIEKLNGRIKGLKWQINNNEVAIDKIKELS